MAADTRKVRPDFGKLLMLPVATWLLVFDIDGLARGAHGGAVSALRWLGTGLTCGFYALVIWCYLRRGRAMATSRSVTAHAVAVAASWAPFVMPLLRGAQPGTRQQFLADVLLAAGTAWAVWSLYFLGRNFSVIAQARGLADRGPYGWVRHPLYTGEIISALGLAIAADSLTAAAVWLSLCGLQAYRARQEEQVLMRALPGYHAYHSHTAALLPGLF